MFGMDKPLTQRGRTGAVRRKHHPAINTAFNSRRGIFDCGVKEEGLFVSSYHEHKKQKYRQQVKDRIKKWFFLGCALLAVAAVAKHKGWTSDDVAGAVGGLRRGAKKAADAAKAATAPDPPPAPEAPKPPPPPAPPPPPPAPPAYEVKINKVCKYESEGKPTPVEKGDDKSICGREIPINLGDPKSWPTPLTPSTNEDDKKEVVLLGPGGGYGGLGSTLLGVFHAYDFAHDKQRPLYVTQDSWILKAAWFKLFFGPDPSLEKNDALWKAVEDTLGVKVVESQDKLPEGITVPDKVNANGLFFHKTDKLDANTMRDHRNTVLRKLFQYPATRGDQNVCSGVNAVVGKDKKKKYAVVHVTATGGEGWLNKMKTGKDLGPASKLEPDYVKNILKQNDMLKNEVYVVHVDPNKPDAAIHGALAKDNDLKGIIKDVPFDFSGCTGSNIYLAVLADVYIGTPVDPLCQIVARMRMALGIGDKTYVLTEKEGENWVSFVTGADNNFMYDRNKMGPFMS